MTSAVWRAGYLETPLGQLHYRECGAGRPLVLLHQPPRSSLAYRRLMEALASTGGLRVIAPDLPGFGLSCDLPSGISMDGVADAVADGISALNCAPVCLFGLHTGNKVGAALAARHPHQVDRLVLAGMTHSIILDAERRNAAMRAYVESKAPTDPLLDPPAWRDEQVDRLNARGVDTLYAANYGFDLASVLPRIQAPTLVIELAIPQEEALGRQAGEWLTLLRSGQAVLITGNDRELLQERPAALSGVISRFISQPDGIGSNHVKEYQ